APAPRNPSWEPSAISNLNRLPPLTDRQKKLLQAQGFFLTPQAPRAAGSKRADGRVDRATHLFHVYERNDYIRFPSLVTADLAMDLTSSYFEAVLRDVEERWIVGQLRAALVDLLQEAETVRSGATSPAAQDAARRASLFWALALRLLDQSSSIPEAILEDV